MHNREANEPDLPQHNKNTIINNESKKMNRTEIKGGAGSRKPEYSSHQIGEAKSLVFPNMDSIMTESQTTGEFLSDVGHILASDSADGLPVALPKKRKSEEFKIPSHHTLNNKLKKKPRVKDDEEVPTGKEKDLPIAPLRRSIGVQKDQASYMLPVVTWDAQAKKEPNFIGDAYYWDLEYEEVSLLICAAQTWNRN